MTQVFKQLCGDPIQAAGPLLVIIGVLGSLTGPDWFIALAGLGLFGPLILREAGALDWRDEFQRETTLRASTHALIAVGILTTGTMATRGYGGLIERVDLIPASTVLWALGLTWGLSKILQFWGAPSGAFRLLLGSTVLLLAVASTPFVLFGTGSSIAVKDTPPSALVWGAILAWAIGLAALSRYQPRTTGWLLLLTAVLAVPLLQDWVAYVGTATRGWTKSIDVLAVAAPILLATGLSLVAVQSHGEPDSAAD